MQTGKPARYEARSIRHWLVMADRAEVALPNFQRSYVWPNQRIAEYLLALFENRPTGTFLILEVQGELTFASRTLKGVTADPKDAQELVLDGQQRLTSLWSVLKGKAAQTFYLRVKDLNKREMGVEKVLFYSATSAQGKRLINPRFAYEHNLVPIDILLDGIGIEGKVYKKDPDEPGDIWHWCKKARSGGDNAARKLEKAITLRLQQRLLLERNLHYCVLPANTEPRVAIEIFVETNKSSTKIRRFDIAVALAQGNYEEDLRERIVRFYDDNPDVGHYFDREREKWIPQVGEWLLKVACLKGKKARAPKEQYFEEALIELFDRGRDKGMEQLDRLQNDLVAALDVAARMGGASRQTLPAWPPIHVIAALQDDLQGISNPAWMGTATRLLHAYLWRSCLTSRYEAQANDRLLEDFSALRQCLGEIGGKGSYDHPPPIFDAIDYPVPDSRGLGSLAKPVQWINPGRVGRALAAVAMQKKPLDWVTGNELDAKKVRDLIDNRKLNRHHVFPQNYLKFSFEKNQINHGLNGVLLSKEGNIFLGQKAPHLYLKRILDNSGSLKESELRRRVESHLVPYDVLMDSDISGSLRFRKFVKGRAELMARVIVQLVDP